MMSLITDTLFAQHYVCRCRTQKFFSTTYAQKLSGTVETPRMVNPLEYTRGCHRFPESVPATNATGICGNFRIKRHSLWSAILFSYILYCRHGV